jgi:Ferritin-like domain
VSAMKNTAVDLSDRELLAMTRHLDQMHRDLLPSLREAVAEMAEGCRAWAAQNRALNRLAATRRNFLRGGLVTAGSLGGGMLLVACGGTYAVMPGGGSAAGPPPAPDDLTIARLSAALEVLAVDTYQTVQDAASKGALGAVPPAIGTFVATAKSQHVEHQDAFNAALTAAGMQAQTAADPHYQKEVDAALPNVKTVTDAAKLAVTLETVAAATYTVGAAQVADKAHRRVLLAIAPVEAQHIAILRFVLGQEPVPDPFFKTDMAASTKDLSEG